MNYFHIQYQVVDIGFHGMSNLVYIYSRMIDSNYLLKCKQKNHLNGFIMDN